MKVIVRWEDSFLYSDGRANQSIKANQLECFGMISLINLSPELLNSVLSMHRKKGVGAAHSNYVVALMID